MPDTAKRPAVGGFGLGTDADCRTLLLAMATRLFLIRHAETAWAVTHQHTGRTDIPLDDTGIRQADELAECLREVQFAHVFTSPLLRARQTCEHAGFRDATIDHQLVEWDYGEYEGKKTDDILKTRPGWNIFRDGCPGGESAGDIIQRADAVIARLVRLDSDIALFSHGHFLRVLTTRWLGWPVEHAQELIFGPASISLLGSQRDERALELWNRAGRLTPPQPRL
jgi:broad specificity phosphatase PhoE